MARPFSEKKRKVWKERILLQQQSGISAERWCKENNLSPHTFSYWKRKLFSKDVLTHSSFKELKVEEGKAITIEYGNLRIHLDQQSDALTLKRFLQVLREITC
jgi:hypothetical protein